MKIDLVLLHGAIYDGIDPLPYDYLAIGDGKVLRIGRGSARDITGSAKEVINLGGRAVTPGVIDAHLHLLDYAWSLSRINLDGCVSEADVVSRLKERASAPQPGEWITGRGWLRALFGEWPHRKLLDRVFPENPVALNSRDGHFLWANTRAIELSGVSSASPPVAGGYIGKDPDGSLNGIFGENAVNLITNNIPKPDKQSRKNSLLNAQRKLHQAGIVGLHSTDGNQAFGDLQELHAEEKLRLRVFHSIPLKQLEHAVDLSLKTGLGDRWFRFGFVKIFSDGALGPQSALMLEPYEGTRNYGIEVLTEDQLAGILHLALANGIAAAVHAIGDKANRQVLNAFQRNHEHIRTPAAWSRIEHVQLLHPDDISRFAALGIAASMQPIHAISDVSIAKTGWGDRTRYAYAWRSLLAAKAFLLFGSDAPIEDPDPLPGLKAAVQRWNWEDKSQVISPLHALQAYTVNPALAAGESKEHGTLQPGKLADFVVFSDDPLRTNFDAVKVLATAVEGEFVYREI